MASAVTEHKNCNFSFQPVTNYSLRCTLVSQIMGAQNPF